MVSYQQRAKSKRLAQCQIRSARLKALPGTFTEQDKADLYAEAGGRCQNPACTSGPEVRLVLDHIVPITQPGSSNAPWNRQLLCNTCNCRKASKKTIDYRAMQERMREEILDAFSSATAAMRANLSVHTSRAPEFVIPYTVESYEPRVTASLARALDIASAAVRSELQVTA
jgi:5-methylcytosine-specific restriction endonuclease McrA